MVPAMMPVGKAIAQSLPPILLELPDRRVVSLDAVPLLRGRLQIALPRFSKVSNWTSRTISLYATAAPFCGPMWAWVFDGSAAQKEAARQECDQQVVERMVDYPQADRDRCACAEAISGRADDKLRVSSEVLVAPTYYAIATIAVTRGSRIERMRGYHSYNVWGEHHIYNAERQVVCSGRLPAAGSEWVYSCFGGRLVAKGGQRQIWDDSGVGRWLAYTVGRFELSNGERIDFVANLNEAEIRRRLPKFPD